jgi:AhpD family alkylhydroperoxidase
MQLEQRDKELAAIGASIGCNCRPCAEHHIPAGRQAGLFEAELADAGNGPSQRHIHAALERELSAAEVAAALKAAAYVQKRASEMTADKATHVLDEQRGGAAGG